MQLSSPSLPVDPTALPTATAGLMPGLGAPAGAAAETAAFGSVLASAQSASSGAPDAPAAAVTTTEVAVATAPRPGNGPAGSARPAGLMASVRTAAKPARGLATGPTDSPRASSTSDGTIGDDTPISGEDGNDSDDASESGTGSRRSKSAPAVEPALAAAVMPATAVAPAPVAVMPVGDAVNGAENDAAQPGATTASGATAATTADFFSAGPVDTDAAGLTRGAAKPGTRPEAARAATTAVATTATRLTDAPTRSAAQAAASSAPGPRFETVAAVDRDADADADSSAVSDASPVPSAARNAAARPFAPASVAAASSSSVADAAAIPNELRSDPSTSVELKSFSVTPADVPADGAWSPASADVAPLAEPGLTAAPARRSFMDAKRSLLSVDGADSGRTPSAPTPAAAAAAARSVTAANDPTIARPLAAAPAPVTPVAPAAPAPGAMLVAPATKAGADAAPATDLANLQIPTDAGLAAPSSPSPRRGPAMASSTAAQGAEKIAAPRSGLTAPVDATGGDDAGKKSVSIGKKQVADSYDPLGTNVAKSSDLMSSASASPHASVVHPGRDVAPSPVTTEAPAPAQPQLADAARRTVETVMIGADRYASDAKAVNLHFTVSGVDLAVHVALRGDAIHTTFRTDSPELRTALAEQWRDLAGDRSERMADPVFSSTHSDSGFSGGEAQSRDSSARQQAPAAPWASTLARTATRTAAGASAPAAVPATPSRPATTRLLHAFA